MKFSMSSLENLYYVHKIIINEIYDLPVDSFKIELWLTTVIEYETFCSLDIYNFNLNYVGFIICFFLIIKKKKLIFIFAKYTYNSIFSDYFSKQLSKQLVLPLYHWNNDLMSCLQLTSVI